MPVSLVRDCGRDLCRHAEIHQPDLATMSNAHSVASRPSSSTNSWSAAAWRSSSCSRSSGDKSRRRISSASTSDRSRSGSASNCSISLLAPWVMPPASHDARLRSRSRRSQGPTCTLLGSSGAMWRSCRPRRRGGHHPDRAARTEALLAEPIVNPADGSLKRAVDLMADRIIASAACQSKGRQPAPPTMRAEPVCRDTACRMRA